MLVLTRSPLLRKGSDIYSDAKGRIHLVLKDGQRIIISLLDVERSRARLGIDAPQEVRIYREELLDRDHFEPAKE